MWRGFLAMILFVTLGLVGCGSAIAYAPTAPAHSSGCQPLPEGAGPYTYVAIGASDAVGFGATCPDTQGYVPLLTQRMPAGTRVDNLGINGEKVKAALVDELPDALAAKPNIITVWLAANDFRAMENGTLTLAEYAQELDQMLAGLQAGSHAHVYVANLPDLTKLPYFQHGTVPLATVATQNAQWNATIAAAISKHGDVLVDLFHSDIASHPEYIFADGFHPSTLGYTVLADAFFAIMQTHGDPKL